MATEKSYFEYVMYDLLSSIEGVSFRYMMGEYILYINGKIFGGIYDNQFLVKQTPTSKKILADSPLVYPYEGSKTLMFVTETEDKETLRELIYRMETEL